MTTDIIDEMLRNSKTIAVVGMSDKPSRASYNIGRYLAQQGYRVLPVNPVLKEIDGQPVYATLDEAQAVARQNGKGIDIVDVFIRLGIPYLWLQDGVVHDEAVTRAQAAGVRCIQNDCIFRQHAARVR